MAQQQEDDVVGKAYDSRLMKRLMGYLRPYAWQTIVAVTAIILKAGMDVLGPYLTKTAIDKYLAPESKHTLLDPWLSSQPLVGIGQVSLMYVTALLLIFLATMIFRKKVRESYRRIRTAIARINSYLQEHVSGIVVLQLFNRERRSFKEFEKVNAQHMEAYKDAIMAHAVYYPVVEILSATAVASVIWFGGNQALRSAVSLGVLVAFMQYAPRFFRPIQDLSEKYNILQAAMASSERIFKLLDSPVEVVSPTVPKRADGAGRIELDHVWFAYRE